MMFSLDFAIRRLIRHWRLNLAVLFGLTLASTLLASLPSFAQATAATSLKQAIADAPPVKRNIQVNGPVSTLNASFQGYVYESIEDLNPERLVVRNTIVQAADGEVTRWLDLSEIGIPHYIGVWSFDKLQSHMKLVTGNWPVHVEPRTQAEALKAPVIQAVIDRKIIDDTKLQIGDSITDENQVEFQIVGIVERLEPEGDIWWGDDSPFTVNYLPRGDYDIITLPVLIHENSMKTYYGRHDVHWRIILDSNLITVENVHSIESGLINLKTRLESNNGEMSSGLPNLLLEYRSNLAAARMALFLLSIQAVIFTLYTLVLIASLLLERSRSEIATLASRGASSLRITLSFSIEILPLAFIAGAILGPLLSLAALQLWSWISTETVPAMLPFEAWLWALGGAFLGWLAVVIPAYPAARHSLLDWQHQISRPRKSSWWQRIYLDVLLLIVGLLLYWQLSSSGSFVIRRLRDTSLSDPLLLLSPTIIVLACAMLFIRIFPIILRFFAWLTRKSRGIVTPLGLARLARDPIRSSRVVLLISLAIALTLFARAFSDSLTKSQQEFAYYQTGADLRIASASSEMEDIVDLSQVEALTPVFRGQLQRNDGAGIDVIAIDPISFPQVARYPAGMSTVSIATIARVVSYNPSQVSDQSPQSNNSNPYTDPSSPKDVIPAIFSHNALPPGTEIGDTLDLSYFGHQIPVEVRGTIVDFPTVNGAFAILDQQALQTIIDIRLKRFESGWETWIDLIPDAEGSTPESLQLQSDIIADATLELRALQRDALTQGAKRAFSMNAFILTILSLTGFILLTYFVAQQRTYEFSVLRAVGVSTRQMLRLLTSEGVLIMLLGLVSGSILGYILAAGMRPYLIQALSRNLPGTTTYQVWLNLPGLSILYIILITFYTIAILMLLYTLMRVGIHKTMRLGEE